MKKITSLLAVLAFAGWSGASNADFIDIDLSGWEAWGGYTDVGNTSTNISLPNGTNIIGAEYIGLEFESFGISWNSELVLSLNDSIDFIAGFWDSTIAGTTDTSGVFGPVSASFTNPGYLSSGPFSLSTGDLYIEVYDTFVDNSNPDQLISSGNLRVEYESVPEPATLALFGIGLAGLGFARRKKNSA